MSRSNISRTAYSFLLYQFNNLIITITNHSMNSNKLIIKKYIYYYPGNNSC